MAQQSTAAKEGKKLVTEEPSFVGGWLQSMPSIAMLGGDDDAQIDELEANGIDWASADQVSAHVSKATLHGMQQLWRQHANAMDNHGRSFAEQMYGLHSQAVKELASMKTFDLKQVMALLNTFTASVRDNMLTSIASMRQQDDGFAQSLYQTTRRTFGKNLKEAVEARDAWYTEKLKAQRQKHEAALHMCRAGTAEEMKQQVGRHKAEMARVLAKAEERYAQALAVASGAATLTGADSDAAVAASKAASVAAEASFPSPPSMESSESDTTSGAATERGKQGGGKVSMSGVAVGGKLSPVVEGLTHGEALEQAQRSIEELKEKMEQLSAQLLQEKTEATNWKNKWAAESTKTDAIKKECLQVMVKCEDHVRSLQQHHLNELAQRDYILQRCKDTISRLEAKLSGEPSQLMQVPPDMLAEAGRNLASGARSGKAAVMASRKER